MISYAKRKKMYVSISTNGHFISEKNIDQFMSNTPDKIIFSLDGLDEKSYQSYRVGGSFKKAEDALKLLVHAKRNGRNHGNQGQKNPFIELQFLVMKQNEHFVNDVVEYGKNLGVDKVTLKTMQISSYENLLNFLPGKEKYGRYVKEGNGYRIKNKLYNHCFLLWKSSVITWDGEVVPCCFDKDAQYRFGNVFEDRFEDIWKSEGYSEFRRKILTGRKNVDICSNCTSGLKMNISSIDH
jgi:radical SAM protein with 4Fe4S-binding SPASM domain